MSGPRVRVRLDPPDLPVGPPPTLLRIADGLRGPQGEQGPPGPQGPGLATVNRIGPDQDDNAQVTVVLTEAAFRLIPPDDLDQRIMYVVV
ncbi:MAG: hypothetical protein LBK54_10260 [Propionibacteriaceae bacterium]|nr:hypothetical protein [Propionibacteriaceae bacterium]